MKNRSQAQHGTVGRLYGRLLLAAFACLPAAACSQPEVACTEMAEPPRVMRDGTTLVVIVEPLKHDSSIFVDPRIKFDGREIEIHGTRLFRKFFKKRVDIPQASLEATGPWKAYWIDPDGTRTLLPVEAYIE